MVSGPEESILHHLRHSDIDPIFGCAGQLRIVVFPRKTADSLRSGSSSGRLQQYIEENVAALNIELTTADLGEISTASPAGVTAGQRYPDAAMQAVNR